MRRSVGIWEFFGFALTSLLGTLLHFLYDLTGGSAFVALFSGVNESTWEHMKLLFWPMLLFCMIQSRFFSDREDFWCIKLRGTLIGLGLIPVLFYSYNGVIGRSPDWINITIFFISAAVAYLYEARRLKGEVTACRRGLAIFLFCAIAAAFVIFTFMTPEIGVFRDPITGRYGI